MPRRNLAQNGEGRGKEHGEDIYKDVRVFGEVSAHRNAQERTGGESSENQEKSQQDMQRRRKKHGRSVPLPPVYCFPRQAFTPGASTLQKLDKAGWECGFVHPRYRPTPGPTVPVEQGVVVSVDMNRQQRDAGSVEMEQGRGPLQQSGKLGFGYVGAVAFRAFQMHGSIPGLKAGRSFSSFRWRDRW